MSKKGDAPPRCIDCGIYRAIPGSDRCKKCGHLAQAMEKAKAMRGGELFPDWVMQRMAIGVAAELLERDWI